MDLPALRPRRPIEGVSAVLLPFLPDDRPDWTGFEHLIDRTWRAGLTPAVNMDTGYVHLLDGATRTQVLTRTSAVAAGRPFVAGAFIEGETGPPARRYLAAIDHIRAHGGTPILFPCSDLAAVDEDAALAVYRDTASAGGPLLAFELGQMFASFGRIYSADFIGRLMDIEAFVGVKHSSLDRVLEWQRLELRDRVRPDFRIYTGNDLAINMVFYGSDYLLGLSAFHVEAFARRDQLWARGDARAVALNDDLQFLGQFAFRAPVPAYKHSAAQFLHLRGAIACDRPHPLSPRRPDADEPVLAGVLQQIEARLAALD